jgi:putative flippase GtrA
VIEFVLFLLVGTIGFAVDLGMFLVLTHETSLPLWFARALCFPPAVLATWWLNRTFTFHGRGLRHLPLEATLYASIQALGAFINFAVFCAVSTTQVGSTFGSMIAFASGSAAALTFNFSAAKLALYRRAE